MNSSTPTTARYFDRDPRERMWESLFGISSRRMGLGVAFLLLLATEHAKGQTEQPPVSADAAESRTVARRMADEAANLYETGNYAEARDLFHRANQLYSAPVLELWEARALDKLDRLVEAEERYASVMRYKVKPEDSDVVRAAVRDAGVEVERLRNRIPTVTITLRGAKAEDPSVEVHLDGKRVNPALIGFPIPVDVGSRNVKLIVKGRETLRIGLTLVEGDRKPIELDSEANVPAEESVTNVELLRPVPRAANDPKKDRQTPWYKSSTIGWIGVSLGAAGLSVGATAGLVASAKHGSLSKQCPNNVCPAEYSDDLESFRTYRTVSTLGYTVGALAAAAGITLLVIAPHESKSPGTPSLALRLGTSAVSLVGRF